MTENRSHTAKNARQPFDSLWRILLAFALCFSVTVAPGCSSSSSATGATNATAASSANSAVTSTANEDASANDVSTSANTSQLQQQDAGQPAVPYNGEDAVPYVGDPAQPNAPPAGNAAGAQTAPGASTPGTPGAQAAPSAQSGAQPSLGGNLTVRFLDVGQGDSALLTCNGESMLIDGGPSKASDKIFSVLRDLGITRLKAIVATHGDADHIGGLAAALTGASTDAFYCSTYSHNTKTFQKLKDKLGSQPIIRPARGDSFTLGGATVQFLGPSVYGDDSNNNSLVCKVTFGSRSFLFTGDAESESEGQLLRSGQNLRADVLKVGHHGSRSSSTAAFLRAVAPAYAVVSVGKNSYGHPTAEVLNRLGSAGVGAQTLRTDQLGTIYFQTDGTTLTQTASTGKVTW